MTKEKSNNRIVYLEILRVIGCLAVIMIHTASRYVTKDFGTFNFWVGNIFDGVARFGVPIFVMISGALMLSEDYNLTKEKLIKHLKKMIIFFIFWSVIYCIFFRIIEPKYISHTAIKISNIVRYLVEGHYHLWYIYLVIGLYLITPLLKLWVNDKNKKYVEYFIILSLIFTFLIPELIRIGANYFAIFNKFKYVIDKNLQLTYVGGFSAYYILGWYLNKYDIKKKNLIYILGLLSLVYTIIGTYIISITTHKPVQVYEYLSLNVLFPTLSIFLLIRNKYKNSKNANKQISSISKYSLGIYGVHIFIVYATYLTLNHYGITNAIIDIPIVFIVTLLLSWLISFIFSKIPLLKSTV